MAFFKKVFKGGSKKKKDDSQQFDRFSPRNKSVFIRREQTVDFQRTEPKRHTVRPPESSFERNGSIRKSLDNHRATLNLNINILHENRNLRQSKEYACRRAEYLEQELNAFKEGREAGMERYHDASGTSQIQPTDGHITIVYSRTQTRLTALRKDNQDLRDELLKANVRAEVYRRELDREANQNNALETLVKDTYNIAREESRKHGDTPEMVRNIQRQLESNSQGIMKFLVQMDDKMKEINNRVDIIGRIPAALMHCNTSQYDSLSSPVKEIMKTLEQFIGERWPELVKSLDISPEIIETLRESKLSCQETYWRIMCHWYTHSKTVSVASLERACLEMGIKIFTDKPMTLLHKTAISNQTANLTNDGDARIIVTSMKKKMMFPSSLYDYIFTTEVRYERMVRLLDSIQVMGDDAFSALLISLLDSSPHLAEFLQEEEVKLLTEEIKVKNEASRRSDRLYKHKQRCGVEYFESQVASTMKKDDVRAEVDPFHSLPKEISGREFADLKASVKHCEAMMMIMSERRSLIDQRNAQH